tara:strand:+ start:866 stop:1651 length:786 start_codon:yes stop_codon:yes gene_type:complete
MTDYLLTIITVTYNASSTIGRALHSLDNLPVLTGTSKYLHIVIDGLSSDDTCQIVRRWNYRADFDTRICSETDNGLYDAMNKGLEIVNSISTKWFTFLNADDSFNVLDHEFLAHLHDFDVDSIAFSTVFDFPSGPVVVNPLKKCRPFNSHLGLPFLHQAALYNSRLARGAYFDTRLKIAADYLFMINFVNINNVYFSPIVLTTFDVEGISSSVSALSLKIENSKALFLSNKSNLEKLSGSAYQLLVGLAYDLKLFINSLVR